MIRLSSFVVDENNRVRGIVVDENNQAEVLAAFSSAVNVGDVASLVIHVRDWDALAEKFLFAEYEERIAPVRPPDTRQARDAIALEMVQRYETKSRVFFLDLLNQDVSETILAHSLKALARLGESPETFVKFLSHDWSEIRHIATRAIAGDDFIL